MAEKCPICKNAPYEENHGFTRRDSKYLTCNICGTYEISGSLLASEKHISIPHYLLSGYIRNQNEVNNPWINLNTMNIAEIEKNIQAPDINEQIDMILEYIQKHSKHLGDMVELKMFQDYSLFYCKNMEELYYLCNAISEMKYLKPAQISGFAPSYQDDKDNINYYSLSYSGIARLKESEKRNTDSSKCFVAMSFDDKYDFIYNEGIFKAIDEDAEIQKIGLKSYRVDKDLKISNDQTIVNKIIAGIRSSKCVIADFSGDNHNVYFEAGYAMGFNIPVILMCQKDKFKDEEGRINIKFDLRAHPFFLYENIEDLKDKLRAAIKANIL